MAGCDSARLANRPVSDPSDRPAGNVGRDLLNLTNLSV
jgi:hypothetical protein